MCITLFLKKVLERLWVSPTPTTTSYDWCHSYPLPTQKPKIIFVPCNWHWDWMSSYKYAMALVEWISQFSGIATSCKVDNCNYLSWLIHLWFCRGKRGNLKLVWLQGCHPEPPAAGMNIVSRTDNGYYLYFLPSLESGTSHLSSTAQIHYSINIIKKPSWIFLAL